MQIKGLLIDWKSFRIRFEKKKKKKMQYWPKNKRAVFRLEYFFVSDFKKKKKKKMLYWPNLKKKVIFLVLT